MITDKNNLPKIAKEFKKISDSIVEIGPLGADEETKTVIETHEYGSKDGKIPERAVLRSTFDSKKTRQMVFKALAHHVRLIVEGKSTADQALDAAGVMMVAAVKKNITTENYSPRVQNAESTIKQKGSDKPLVNEGKFLNSIKHEVKGRNA